MAKYIAGTEMFREVMGKASSWNSYFKKGRLFAYGSKYPLVRGAKVTEDMHTVLDKKNKEAKKYVYVEEEK